MAERVSPVRQVKVYMECDVPGCAGQMLPTGRVHLLSIPQYPHECNVCGCKDTFTKRYPCVEVREEI